MPNWVYCNLEIKSEDKIELEKFKSKVSSDESSLTFNAIITRPAHEENNWYDWNIANWGTKWDAADAILQEDENTLVYNFSTAWAPPLPVIDSIAKTSKARIRFIYEEEQGWGGSLQFENGELIDEKTWDIPSTHKEASQRNSGCFCHTTDEQFFEDCFYTRASELDSVSQTVLEYVKGLAPTWSEGFDRLLEASKELAKVK